VTRLASWIVRIGADGADLTWSTRTSVLAALAARVDAELAERREQLEQGGGPSRPGDACTPTRDRAAPKSRT